MSFGPILSPIGQLLPEKGAYVTFYAVGALERDGMVLGDFSTPLRSARNDNRAAERPGFRGFKRFRRFRGCGIACGDEYKASVAYYPYRLPLVILNDSEESRYLQYMRQNR